MSQVLGSNEFICDRCGASVGNGSVPQCIVVSDMDPYRPGLVRNLHFGRECGCDVKVLSKRNMEFYLKDKEEAGDESGSSD